ncbi:GDSL esterase/lipase [Salix suchowensis]|nr:GDSL esterase/lipase [Salix suchowensis]
MHLIFSPEIKLWGTLLVLFAVVSKLQCYRENGDTESQVPCYFIFGDSLADSGNNNRLQTLAKANYSPYGIDFPDGPTGRFCNGRTIVDIIAEKLGFENFIPPFATATGTDIVSGVNYASGSAGIRDETGQQQGQRIPLNKQLRNHQITVSRLIEIIGNDESTALYLSKCLYSVGMGSNDYINNYFLPQYYPSSHEYTLEQFTGLLVDQYKQQLRTLYDYGARKIAVFGLGQLGCTPDAIQTYGTHGSACVVIMNNASQLFNSRLKPVVDQLNEDLTDAKFIYIDFYGISGDNGFEVDNIGCCQVAEGGLCNPNKPPCPNRTEYVFWDSFHPTDAYNVFLAERSYSASNDLDAYPFDIRNLVSLNQGVAASK